MIQTLIRNRWLLAFCAVLDAVISAIYLNMQQTDGPLTLSVWNGTIAFLGKVTLLAGACTIAAGIWRSAKGKCWLLVLNGFALIALGMILTAFTSFRISLRTVALLLVVMATSMGILEWVTARTLRGQHHVTDEWLLGLAGAGSVGFALAFFGLGFHWIKVEPGSRMDLLWIGCYFGFSAICMLALALRLNSLQSGMQRMASSPL